MIRRLLCVAAVAAAAGPAAAGSDPLQAAWEAAGPGTGGLVNDDELAQLNVIAYHGAVASLCEGYVLDEAQVATATNAVLQDVPAGMTAEQQLQRHVDVLIALGTARGLFLAEGALGGERFCAAAKETRDAPDFDDFWKD